MKKLIIILIAVVLQSCSNPDIHDILVIKSLTETNDQTRRFKYELITNSKEGKYTWGIHAVFYSNKRYNIGDTLIK